MYKRALIIYNLCYWHFQIFAWKYFFRHILTVFIPTRAMNGMQLLLARTCQHLHLGSLVPSFAACYRNKKKLLIFCVLVHSVQSWLHQTYHWLGRTEDRKSLQKWANQRDDKHTCKIIDLDMSTGFLSLWCCLTCWVFAAFIIWSGRGSLCYLSLVTSLIYCPMLY